MSQLTIQLVLFTIFSKALLLNSHPVEIVYKGDACHCAHKLPYQVDTPIIPEVQPTLYDHGYKIDYPKSSHKAKLKYSFDFQMEKPRQYEEIVELQSHGFKVEAPHQHHPNEIRYNFDYNVEIPVLSNPSEERLTDLVSKVDKIVVERKDCPIHIGRECTCNKYQPKIDYINLKPYYQNYPRYHLPLHYKRYDLIQTKDTKTREKRDLLEKRKLKKVPKQMWKEKFMNDKKHKIIKREIVDIPLGVEYDTTHVDSNYDLRRPEIAQFLPEVLSTNYKPGTCPSCGGFKRNIPSPRYEETDSPSEIGRHHHHHHQEYKSNQYDISRPIEDLTPIYNYKLRNNDAILMSKLQQMYDYNRNSKLRNNEYDEDIDEDLYNFIREVVDSHPYFIEASDHGYGNLSPSIDEQNRAVIDLARRLIRERLAQRRNSPRQYNANEENNSDERYNRSLNKNFNRMHEIDPNRNIEIHYNEDQQNSKTKRNGNTFEILTNSYYNSKIDRTEFST